MTGTKTALVFGATGVIGRNMVEHLDRLDDWAVIDVARKPPDFSTKARFVSCDLGDPAACRTALGGLAEVSHMFYAAYTDRPTWAAQRAPNAAMLANAMAAIEPAAPGLRHVCLLQGTKYYGCHLGPFRTPAKEDDPRHMPPNFYFDQQDILIERQRGKAWSWSCLRPHVVCGYAMGTPLNIVSVIAVYAAISRELGLPLRFPGKPGAYRAIYQATDATLLAKAMTWTATEPACANHAFNITNGDFIRWENTWPAIAADFGMTAGPVQQIDLAEFMADKAPVWDAMVEKYDLQPNPFARVAHWPFGNYVFASDWDIMSDTGKARRFGFREAEDTEAMFLRHFATLRRERVIP